MQLITNETETKQIEMNNRLKTSKHQNKQNKHSNIVKEHGMTVKMENLRCELVKPKRSPLSKCCMVYHKLQSSSSVSSVKTLFQQSLHTDFLFFSFFLNYLIFFFSLIWFLFSYIFLSVSLQRLVSSQICVSITPKNSFFLFLLFAL